MIFAPQKTLFDFLVIVYNRVGDGENFSYKNSGLGSPRFHATVTKKLKQNNFSGKR